MIAKKMMMVKKGTQGGEREPQGYHHEQEYNKRLAQVQGRQVRVADKVRGRRHPSGRPRGRSL